ncbi:MAG TPA: hypothetical protein VN376_02075 [Longilinea sp.]|nr:hypothetical protein [Longilinea sp.]
MKRKIFGLAFLVLVEFVVWGAVNRTSAGVENEESAVTTPQNHTVEVAQTAVNTTDSGLVAAVTETAAGGNADVTPGDGDGIPDASENIDGIFTLEGTVFYVDSLQMTVDTSDGQVLLENRPWTFLVSLGFSASAGDELRLTGFYEDGVFEVMSIEQISSGTIYTLRDEDGRPMWAGGRG